VDQVAPLAREYDHVVMHTSTPSFGSDVRVAERLKHENPGVLVGMVGAHVAVLPAASLGAARAVDWVGVGEFDHACAEVSEGRRLADVKGIAYRDGDRVRFTLPRPPIEDMDALPFVVDVYRRDLTIENYFIGYLLHPYVSLYTGRGCRSKCTFCLWPQTVGGHRYRTRSVEDVVEEIKWAKAAFPQVKEFFFDDDTLTDNLPRVEALAKALSKVGVVWSCNAKANVPRKTLEILKDNGLRLFLVGYESGNQQILHNIKKGMRVDVARRFTKDCHELGIVIHGTFILGLPGETKETIQETLDFAKQINPHTIQVSLAAPYPGTFLYKQAKENGWLYNEEIDLLTKEGTQIAPLNYPHLSHTEIFQSVEDFYKKFYFRPSKIASIVAEMIASPEMMKRRLREGVEFFHFLRARQDAA
jgi:hopanoid biosynthesis associated radical SAM protein HpnJ